MTTRNFLHNLKSRQHPFLLKNLAIFEESGRRYDFGNCHFGKKIKSVRIECCVLGIVSLHRQHQHQARLPFLVRSCAQLSFFGLLLPKPDAGLCMVHTTMPKTYTRPFCLFRECLAIPRKLKCVAFQVQQGILDAFIPFFMVFVSDRKFCQSLKLQNRLEQPHCVLPKLTICHVDTDRGFLALDVKINGVFGANAHMVVDWKLFGHLLWRVWLIFIPVLGKLR